MQHYTSDIPDLIILQPNLFGDERGHFFESYNKKVFQEIGIDAEFVQDNQSMSHKNVLRGLHFQNPPYDQGKLVRVIKGAVMDVAVDLRKGSPAYGKHFSLELSEANKTMMWIPPGFAHGFLTLEDHTIFHYKCTGYYNKNAESGIIWNDPDLNILWNVTDPIVSGKDLELPAFSSFNSLFS
jgi:dTDP-4-dehydrorhamnose 3,5-epimerase